MNVDELAPNVGQAGDRADMAGTIQVYEPGMAVRCPAMVCLQTMRGGGHPAGILGQMVLRVFAFAAA